MDEIEKGNSGSKIKRAEGVTPTERYLQRLCQRSFLSLWSYCGLYKNQGRNGKGDGKELCDLLVVFGNDVLVFSDKDCAFKDTGNIGVDWCRWFRKSIADSARQAWRVEPFIKHYADRIYLDRACKEPFPLTLPLPEHMRMHYIVVTHKIAPCVTEYFNGGSGSLVFNSDLTAPSQYENPAQCRPFEVGWLDEKKPFVHVLHDLSLEAVLKTLDTITDFVEYLRAKEALLEDFKRTGRSLFYCGEEDLLAHYIRTMRGDRHGFDFPPEVQRLALEEGAWLNLVDKPKFLAREQANKVSYYWDAIIEKFTRVVLNDYQKGETFTVQERALRFLAREGRVRRRMLAEEMLKMVASTPYGYDRRRVAIPERPGEPYYVFLLAGRRPDVAEQEYPRFRQNMLSALCNITKLRFPAAEDIVGIATETGTDTRKFSYDLTLVDARNWTQDDQAHWSDMQKSFGFLNDATTGQMSTVEFPEPEPQAPEEDTS